MPRFSAAVAVIPLSPVGGAIEAGIFTELSAGLAIVGLLSIVTFVLRSFRSR
jgi:hypothetical protein